MGWDGDRRQLAALLLQSLICALKMWEEELANAICSVTGRYSRNAASPPYQRVNSEEILMELAVINSKYQSLIEGAVCGLAAIHAAFEHKPRIIYLLR